MGNRQELFSGALKLPVYNGWGWQFLGMDVKQTSLYLWLFFSCLRWRKTEPSTLSKLEQLLGEILLSCVRCCHSLSHNPKRKQILTSGAPAIARGHTHGQAAETGRDTSEYQHPAPPTTHTPHTHTPTLLVWMGLTVIRRWRLLPPSESARFGGGQGCQF